MGIELNLCLRVEVDRDIKFGTLSYRYLVSNSYGRLILHYTRTLDAVEDHLQQRVQDV